MTRLPFRALVLLFASLSLALCGQAQTTTANRVVLTVDNSHALPLQGDVSPEAQAQFDRGLAPASHPTGRLMLLLQRSNAQQQALTQYLSDVQNPSSPQYHQWLTPAKYGAEFGISDSDLSSVESWLSSEGFQIDQVPAARNLIEFSGNFSQVQQAFHTEIHTFAANGETHYANVTNPSIPAALAPVVAGVGPLNDFHPQPLDVLGPRGQYDPATHSIQPQLTLFTSNSQPLLFVDPADAATIYDTPNQNLNPNYTSGTTYAGAGVNIGIAGDSNITMQDVENYRTAFLGESTASVNLPTVVVDGNDPGLNGDEVEALLDNEVAGGMAPGAKIYFYTSADTDLSSGLFNAIQRALNDNTVSILSISFGECEAQLGASGNQLLLELMEQAAAQGITVTVSTGDSGTAGCDDFNTEQQAGAGFAVSGFASTPYDVAVGGTDFDALAGNFTTYATSSNSGVAPYSRTAQKYIPEEPWNDSTSTNGSYSANVPATDSSGAANIVAGSGGVSSTYSKPAFQSSLTPADGKRDLPDVSLLAGNGLYDALWVLCADNVAEGVTGQPYTDCQNDDGGFNSGTTFSGVGGTSAAAPAFAGILALVEQKAGHRLGAVDPTLYLLGQSKYASVFHDITDGNNSVYCKPGSPDCGSNDFLNGYNATGGYDLATGLGSVDTTALVNDWNSVSLTSTSISLTINGSTSPITTTHGTALQFGVSVNPSSATGVAGIIDTASGGSDSHIIIPITGGSGSTESNELPGGTYTVTARYSGDTANASSISEPINVIISPEASTTALSMNAYNPQNGTAIAGASAIPYGDEIFLDAKIEGAGNTSSTQGTATGTVTFANGATTLGTASVSSNNQASYPPASGLVAFAPGTYSVTASYPGDSSYNASKSAAQAFTITKAATAMALSTSEPSLTSQTYSDITLTVTTPQSLGSAPAGTFTLSAGGTTLSSTSNFSTYTQTSGNTTYEVLQTVLTVQGSQLASGPNTVTGSFSGDGNYAGSSSTITITNSSGAGSFTLTNSGDITLTAGQTANVTLTVTPAGGFGSTVSFACSAFPDGSCQAQIANVTGTSAVTSQLYIATNIGAAPGTYPITVTGTDETGKITATTSFNVVVKAVPANAGISLSVSAPPTNPVAGGNAFAPYTVTPLNGYVGNVVFTCQVTTSIANATGLPTCNGYLETITTNAPVAGSAYIGTSTTTTLGEYTMTLVAMDQNNSSITAIASTNFTVGSGGWFTLSGGGDISVAPGATTGNTSTISVTPGGSFTGQVNLSCTLTSSPTGAADLPACSIPAAVAITGTAAASATLTVNTTGGGSAALDRHLRGIFFGGGGVTLACLLFFGVPARRRGWRNLLGMLVLLLFLGAIGCSGGSGSGGGSGGSGSTVGTTAGNYVFTVTGRDTATGLIFNSTTVNVTVN